MEGPDVENVEGVMRVLRGVASIALLFVFACGSADSGLAPAGSSTPPPAPPTGFTPPPVAAGYTRIVAPDVTVDTGGDVMFCQYVQGPLDHDVDILDVRGFQSAFGRRRVCVHVNDADRVHRLMHR